MSATFIILATAFLVVIASSMLGVFVVLKRQSMMSDAISHSILPGIVIGFWLSGGETATIPALIGASMAGFVTVLLVEALSNSKLIKNDAAIGAVFPLLFSMGVVMISLYFRNVHLDLDSVLYGEIAYAPLNNTSFFGAQVPESLILMGSIAILNTLFISLFYKELKVSTFDEGLATSLGFPSKLINYALMFLLSITTVMSFQSVGAILIVAFVVIPASIAYLFTNRLSIMLGLSCIIGIIASYIGYFVALKQDLSIAGSIAGVLGLMFILAIFCSPLDGIISKILRNKRQKTSFAQIQIQEAQKELGQNASIAEIANFLQWKEKDVVKIINKTN